MIYFDAAFVAKFYLDEPESDAVRALAFKASEVASSELTKIELASVFHRKFREQIVGDKGRADLGKQFKSDCEAELWIFLPVTSPLLDQTGEKINHLPRTTFLRASDALHLTTAAENGFKEIYSNDRHLLAAARHFGLKGVNVV